MSFANRTGWRRWAGGVLALAAILCAGSGFAATISINDVQVLEGNSGTVSAVFTVSLSEAGTSQIQVSYATAAGTATAGVDYQTVSGTLTFPIGTLTQTISVPVIGDTVIEPNETFLVNLSTPVNATIARSQGTGTIIDNETRTLWFTNSAAISTPSGGAATPYPSVITLSGVPGKVSQVKVALDKLEHSYPDDLDILLVNSRTNVLLMSDRGGANAITNVNLVFDDAASSVVPDSSTINSGTFKPSNDGTLDVFVSPAPVPPHGVQLAPFAGVSPNDTWSLYIQDDTGGDAGVLRGGWRLSVTTTNLVSAGGAGDADLSVTMTPSCNPALTELPLVWLLTVINSGPAAATGVVASNTLPAGVQFVSATSSQGSCSQVGGVVTASLGNLAVGAVATVRIQVTPTATGTLMATAGVSGAQTDQAPANNTATAVTAVEPGPPFLSVGDVVVTERTGVSTNAIFSISMSRPAEKTVTVNYTTADGTASASSDYYGVSGTLTFASGVTNLTVEVTVLGDRVVETNETFSLNLSSPINAMITRASAVATIVNDDGAAGGVDHFQWSSIGSPQYQYVPCPVTLTAVDALGNPVTGFNGTVSFTGLTGTGTNTPRLLITEIDQSSDGIELENVTSLPVDLTGWSVYFYDWTIWPYPAQVFDFPAGAVAPAGGVMTIRDTGVAPGSYPAFYVSQGISWFNEATNNQVAVLLVDPAGQPADFFCEIDAYPVDIATPLPISTNQWSGSPVPANIISTYTYQRTSATDHNDASDWTLAANTMGTANSGIAGPFTGPRLVSVSPASSGNFTSGTWSGTVTANESITNLYVLAQDSDGHAGASGWFAVQPSVDVALSQTAAPASQALGQDVTFTLRLTNSGPAAAQGIVVVDTLPAGVIYKSSSVTQGSVSQSGSTVTANLGTLAVGGQATVTVTGTAAASGGITNSATVSTTSVDYQPTNNTASAGVWVNYLPTISSTSSQYTLEDAGPVTASFTIGDVETPVGSLVLWATSSSASLIPTNNLVFGGTGANRTLTMTPMPNQFGLAFITIYVADPQNTVSNRFNLVVTTVNDAPSFTAGPSQTVLEDAGAQAVAGWATAISPGPVNEASQTLTFNASNNNPSLFAVQPAVAANGTLTFTTATNAVGSATVTLTLQDNGGTANGGVDTSPPQSFTITATPVNDRPTFVKGADQVVNEDCGPVTVASWATSISPGPADESGQTVSFLVTNDNNALFSVQPSLTPAGTLSYTPATNANGAAVVTVRLQDNGGTVNGGLDTSVTQTFNLTVNAVNDAPVLQPIASQALDEGTLLTVDPVASDVESPPQTLTFALVSGPSGVSVNASSGRVSWTPTESQGPTNVTITLRVFDNGTPSLGATQSFLVIVREVNLSPQIGAVPNQTVIESTLMNVQATATDADLPANTLTYGLVSGPTGLTVSSAGLIAWTPPAGFWPATNEVTLRVFDNGTPSLSSTGSFQVVVNHRPVPTSPTLARFAPVALKVLVADLLGTDPDNDTLALQSVAGTSSQGVPVTQDGSWVYYTPTNAVSGLDTVSYVVRDARGATGPGTLTISIQTDTNTTPSLTVQDLGNGSFQVRFTGIPAYNYPVQATASLTNPDWQTIGTVIADDSGLVNFLDTPPGGIRRYYRLAPPIMP